MVGLFYLILKPEQVIVDSLICRNEPIADPDDFSSACSYCLKNPHDAALKSAFEKRELAESFFRHYFPQKIVRQIDFRYLKFANRSYVDEKLKDKHSDIVYQTRIWGKTGFLFETAEKALRLPVSCA